MANAINTGILTDGLRPVDGDIDDPDLAEVIDRLAVEMLGDAPKRYREDSARWLRLYRAAEGDPPHAEVLEDETSAAAAQRKPYGVEILGRGNQFVAVGFHPDGAFLEWADGRSSLTVPRDELPAVTESQIAEFLSVAGELLGAKKPRQNPQNEQPAFSGCSGLPTSDDDPALADVQAALSVIDGDGGSYKVWIRVGRRSTPRLMAAVMDCWCTMSGRRNRPRTMRAPSRNLANVPAQFTFVRHARSLGEGGRSSMACAIVVSARRRS